MSDNSKDKADIAVKFEREVLRCVDGLAGAAIDGQGAADRIGFIDHVMNLRNTARHTVINYPMRDTDSAARIADLETQIANKDKAIATATSALLAVKTPVDQRIETLAREKMQVTTVLRVLADEVFASGLVLPADIEQPRDGLSRAYHDAREMLNGQPAHPDDIAIDRFAAAMKTKMAKKRADGRGGWDDPAQCSTGRLAEMLVDHLPKGDPVDIANFAMMLFHRDGGGRALELAGDAVCMAIQHAKNSIHLFVPNSDYQDFLKLRGWAQDNGWRGFGISGCTALQYCLRELTARVRLEDVPNRAEQPMAIIHDDTKVTLASYSDGLDSIDLHIVGVDGKSRRRRYTADDMKPAINDFTKPILTWSDGAKVFVSSVNNDLTDLRLRIVYQDGGTSIRRFLMADDAERDTVPATAMPAETIASAPKHMTQQEFGSLRPGDVVRRVKDGKTVRIHSRNSWNGFSGHAVDDGSPYGVNLYIGWALVSRARDAQPHMTEKEFDNLQPGDVVLGLHSGNGYVIEAPIEGPNGIYYRAVRRTHVSNHLEWALVSKATQPQPPVSGTSDNL
jgi:uncharacterized coiled-coil protein SlyX